jgi:hypothetical protein
MRWRSARRFLRRRPCRDWSRLSELRGLLSHPACVLAGRPRPPPCPPAVMVGRAPCGDLSGHPVYAHRPVRRGSHHRRIFATSNSRPFARRTCSSPAMKKCGGSWPGSIDATGRTRARGAGGGPPDWPSPSTPGHRAGPRRRAVPGVCGTVDPRRRFRCVSSDGARIGAALSGLRFVLAAEGRQPPVQSGVRCASAWTWVTCSMTPEGAGDELAVCHVAVSPARAACGAPTASIAPAPWASPWWWREPVPPNWWTPGRTGSVTYPTPRPSSSVEVKAWLSLTRAWFLLNPLLGTSPPLTLSRNTALFLPGAMPRRS